MNNFSVDTAHNPTPDEFIELSKAVGWGKDRVYDLQEVDRALLNTSFIVTIRKNGLLIGCGRALSDDLLFTTIPDIFVRPDFQRQGVGRLIMNRIIERYAHTTIFFGSRPGNERFFESLGFVKGMQSYTIRKS